MASPVVPDEITRSDDGTPDESPVSSRPDTSSSSWRQALQPLASLKLTVALFGLSIFLILAGTFAQVDKDIWQVIDEYFRCWFAWIDFQLFFPPSFSPSRVQVPGGIWFPGGWLIGTAMAVNLLAAHAIRFKTQAKGSRLTLGLAALAMGGLSTWMVIASGANKEGFQQATWLSWDALWGLFQLSLIGLVGLQGWLLWKLGPERKLERNLLIGSTIFSAGIVVWLLLQGDAAQISDESMRILWQLMKAEFASLLLLGGCVLVFRKRAGIVLLHGGIGLMMLSELLVGTYAVEAQMHLAEGETTNYVHDIRETELAIIDPTDPDEDRVVAIPQAKLVPGQTITHEALPFDIEVVEYLKHSGLRRRKADEKTPATDGAGLTWEVDELRPGSGTDTGGEVDIASAYIRLKGKDGKAPENLGTRLVSQHLVPEKVRMGTDPLFTIPDEGDLGQRLNNRRVPAELSAAFKKAGQPLEGTLAIQTEEEGKKWGLVDSGPKEGPRSHNEPRAWSLELRDGQLEVYPTWQVALRFRRHYKPYSVHLLDVRKDDYLGTNTAKNYSSDIRLVDPTREVDREIKIWMNNPLRFAGETFYQSSYNARPNPDEPGKMIESTTLSVVQNTGWMIPYVSCMIVATGMLFQFGIVLMRFLKRRDSSRSLVLWGAGASLMVGNVGYLAMLAGTLLGRRRPDDQPEAEPAETATAKKSGRSQKKSGGGRKNDEVFPSELNPHLNEPPGPASGIGQLVGRYLPLVVVVIMGVYLIGKARTPVADIGEMDLHAFGKIPIVYQGRTKPIDTLARNTLLVISNRQTFEEEVTITDSDGKKKEVTERRPAIRWFLDLLADREKAMHHKVFRIENLDLLDTLDLERRSGFRYSLDEFIDKIPEVAKQAELARKLEAEQWSVYQRKVLELEKQIGTVDLMLQAFRAPQIRPESARQDLIRVLQEQQALAARHPPLAIPPQEEDQPWQTFSTAWTQDLIGAQLSDKEPNQALESFSKILVAYSKGEAREFNREVEKYRNRLAADPVADLNVTRVNYEAFFNHFAPFYYAAVLYVFAFVLAALAWLGFSGPLNRASFWLIAFTFGVHTFAMISRIYISGRPPVTNLYSSAVFIGWGCVVLGLILERIYRIGIGNVIASVTGFAALLIAHFLAGDGDTFTVLQAVLDTQFWLATHVTCITFGYATTYMAGVLGVLYIFRGMLTPSLTPQVGKELSRMIYGTLCFAIFFSFVGTVLGGLWADDSWGRFWGWDPKENGALIIVLWNALVLHARWDGMVKERGMAVLAVGGNIVTSWSWFGVNELGVGLHSYGFTDGVLKALGIFVLTQLAVIIAGSFPKDLWWSFRRREASTGQQA